jgi:N-acetylglucosaminyldiphosphoundecaprenol N-acetyl-beta-D-mannosaminyltransferase
MTMIFRSNEERGAIVAGQRINVLNFRNLLNSVMSRANSNTGFTLATLNLDHLVKLRDDEAFRSAYKRMTLVSADGAPIVKLGRRKTPGLERVAGADIIGPICKAAAQDGLRIYFFGSSPEKLEAARQTLQAENPGLIICGLEAPPQGFDISSPAALECGARIAASGAQLCFICLGAPKQELFADRLAQLHPTIGFLCVGAALDFIAGTPKRAPLVLQRWGLEWTWRLLREPRRLGWRYAQCAALYMQLALIDRRLALLELFRTKVADRRNNTGSAYAGPERRQSPVMSPA